MPMRAIISHSSALRVGRAPSGLIRVRGHTFASMKILASGGPRELRRVFDADLTLGAGERRSLAITPIESGTVRLEVTNSRGRSVPATFFITRKGRPGK